jgi:hypothetical protein
MTGDDRQDLTVLASLRSRDVSRRHARRLRSRCHALLLPQAVPETSFAMRSGSAFRRIIAPALGGAWCIAYLVEIVRRAAAVYFGSE